MEEISSPKKLALAALFCSVLLGCGGGGDDRSSAPPPPAPPPVTPPPPPAPAGLPKVINGIATLLAGSLSDDPNIACGRIDSNTPEDSRFGLRTNAMAVKADGSVYLTDQPCASVSELENVDAVRKINPNGAVSTFARGDIISETMPLKSFVTANGLAFDQAGNLYVSDPRQFEVQIDRESCQISSSVPAIQPFGSRAGIWKITPGGNVSVFAGVLNESRSTYSGKGVDVAFLAPGNIQIDSTGLMHVYDRHAAPYRTIDSAGNVLEAPPPFNTHGGNFIASPQGDVYTPTYCTGTNTPIDLVNVRSGAIIAKDIPASLRIAVDARGNVYSASLGNPRLGTNAVVYKKSPTSERFEPVVTEVRDLHAIAVGPSNELFIKSGYAVIKVVFN